jgi:prophage maintenance system killer protein
MVLTASCVCTVAVTGVHAYINDPWLGGNKRTATILVDRFLHLNCMELHTTVNDTVELALAIEADRWDFNAITAWYRQRTFPLSPQRSQ